ncbi:MAG: hypothetical protein WEA84_14170 [Rhodovibrionaceae bacterium]
MTVSRSKALLAALPLALLLSGPGQAQTTQNRDGIESEPLGAPTQLLPPENSTPGERNSSTAPRSEVTGIQVDSLGAPEHDALGVLEPIEGGLGPEMWQGTPRSLVVQEIPEISEYLNSPVARDLARRLLLTSARAPVQQGIGERRESLLALRAERLLALGELEGLEKLLRLVPQGEQQGMVLRARADGGFLRQDFQSACQAASTGIQLYPDDLYWNEAAIACQLANGDEAGAMLGLDLLREQGDGEAGFIALAEAMAGYGGPPRLETLTPLKLAMLSHLGENLSLASLQDAKPAMLAALARTGNLDIESRVRVGEVAAHMGVLPGGELAELYRGFTFTPLELDNAPSLAKSEPGPRSRALLFQAASRAGEPRLQADALAALFDHARRETLYRAAARAALPLLREMAPSQQLVWFSGEAGRALFLAGQFERGGAWLDLARTEYQGGRDGGSPLTTLWPYARLAGFDPARNGLDDATWRRARQALQGEDARRQEILVANALTALGEQTVLPMGGETAQVHGASASATDGGSQAGASRADARRLFSLREAGRAGRLGETVLLSLLVLNGGGAQDLSPQTLGEVLGALDDANLGYEARLLAMEAAAASGL